MPKQKASSISPLPSLLDKKLIAYAAAFTAAGVGTLAAPQSAEAKVVYTAVNENLVFGKTTLDINNDGTADYLFEWEGLGHIFSLFVRPRSSNFVVVYSGWAAPLPAGVTVGPGQASKLKHRPANMEVVAAALSSGTNYIGPWVNAQNMYLGLEITINGQHHYGWARISMPVNAPATITGYAYETVADKPIITGATTDSVKVSEAAPATDLAPWKGNPSLGMLAHGSAGLEAWRREDAVA
jgi:hypothetical protein